MFVLRLGIMKLDRFIRLAMFADPVTMVFTDRFVAMPDPKTRLPVLVLLGICRPELVSVKGVMNVPEEPS